MIWLFFSINTNKNKQFISHKLNADGTDTLWRFMERSELRLVMGKTTYNLKLKGYKYEAIKKKKQERLQERLQVALRIVSTAKKKLH